MLLSWLRGRLSTKENQVDLKNDLESLKLISLKLEISWSGLFNSLIGMM
jgi:hypothetical protein